MTQQRSFFLRIQQRIADSRARQRIAFGVFGLLLIGIGLLFHPHIQTRLVVKFVTPTVERLSIERLHILPWSIEITELDVGLLGGKFAADALSLRFCILSILTRTINIKQLSLEGGRADLRTFAPPPSSSQDPFPGVFSSLDIGFGFKLSELSIDATAQLNETERAELKLTGGGIGPELVGALNYVGRFGSADSNLVEFNGAVEIDQLTRGRFNSIEVKTRAIVTASALPQPERLSAIVLLKPTADPPRREVENADGDIYFEPLPEEVHLTLLQQDADSNPRASIDIDALYDGFKGALNGTYALTTNDKLASPYVDEATLPRFEQSASGELSIDLVGLTGDIALDSRTTITDLHSIFGAGPNVPAHFLLLQDIAMSFTRESLVVEKMETRIEDEHARTILNSVMPQSFAIEFADPAHTLAQANTLLKLDIGGFLIAWFNAMLPDYEIVGGALTANLDVNTDEQGNFALASRQTVVIDDIRIDRDGETLVQNLKVQLTPQMKTTPEQTSVEVQDFSITIDDAEVATARIDVRAPGSAEGATPVHVKLAGDIHLDPVLAQPAVRSRLAELSLPQSLSLHFESALVQRESSVRIDELNIELSHAGNDKLIEIKSKQPFAIQTTKTGRTFDNPAGDLATIAVRDIELAWLTPFAKPYNLTGALRGASFTLQTAPAGKLVLSPDAALQIERLRVDDADNSLLRNVWLSVRPKIEYSADATHLSYDGLRVSGGRRHIIGGKGDVTLTPGGEGALGIEANGHLNVTLNNLAAQPVIAAALPAENFITPLSTQFSYRLSHTDAVTRIRSLDLKLLHEKTPYIGIQSATGLTIRPTLKEGENLAQHAVGEIKLSINDLNTVVLADFLPGDTLSFDTINGELHLSSDGQRLSARSEKALAVSNVRVTDADGNAVLHPFDVKTSASIEAAGQTFDATVEEFSLNFHGAAAPALSGKLSATLEPEHTVALRRLNAEFTGELPQLLNQPSVLPGHALTSGALGTTVTVEPNGNITANTKLDQLASAQALAIHTIEMPLNGNMREDGKGFDFTMPLVGTGKSGFSDARTVGEYLPLPDQPSLLHLQVDSDLFYLNDILATINGISGKPATSGSADDGEEDGGAPATPVEVDETPDSKAFWAVLPYSARVEFDFKQVFYSDYVAFTDIVGRVDISDESLTLSKFSSHFHESPITFDGGLAFMADEQDPYTVELTGKIEDFNLNQFFTELTPDKRSRIEGLFGIDVEVAGKSPNAAQFRNRLLLDLDMQSRDGVFRPLPPDSALIAGASDALGVIGEGLSYIPTGGFGAGAVSRLVNYIAEIEYDTVDVRIKRDSSLDLKIEKFEVLSPNIRVAATGAVERAPGTDILDSPLTAVANLNMVGKGAAILYSMDLLEDEQDKFGYWKGPEFKVWGSIGATESNLEDIIQRAGDGTVKGAITRPISGLIGNVKHRWFGGDAALEAAKREAVETDPARETEPDAVTP